MSLLLFIGSSEEFNNSMSPSSSEFIRVIRLIVITTNMKQFIVKTLLFFEKKFFQVVILIRLRFINQKHCSITGTKCKVSVASFQF